MFDGIATNQLYEAERPRRAAERNDADRQTGRLFAALRPEAREHHAHVALPVIRALRVQ
jgi:hypothetical protein